MTSQDALPACQDLEELPILNNIIRECMRLRVSLPVPNPRITPYNRKTTLGPYRDIPGGVRTNSYAWCMHHDPHVYPEPYAWKPERWACTGKERQAMDNEFWLLGSGSHVCLGMHLVSEMIRYNVAAIYTNFSTKIVSDEAWATEGLFVTGLPGQDLLLDIEPL